MASSSVTRLGHGQQHVTRLGHGQQHVTSLGDYFKDLGNKFSFKINPNIWAIENRDFFNLELLWILFWETIGTICIFLILTSGLTAANIVTIFQNRVTTQLWNVHGKSCDIFSFRYSSYRRYFGIVIGHYQVALYSARRDEMVEVVQATLFYMNPDAPIPVHSLRASIPYEVKFWLWLDL